MRSEKSGNVMTEAPQYGIKGLHKRRGLEFLPAATNILNKFERERLNPAPYISHELIDFLARHYRFYLEVRNGAMLAFARSRLANSKHIALLFALAEIFNAPWSCFRPWQASAGTLSPGLANRVSLP